MEVRNQPDKGFKHFLIHLNLSLNKLLSRNLTCNCYKVGEVRGKGMILSASQSLTPPTPHSILSTTLCSIRVFLSPVLRSLKIKTGNASVTTNIKYGSNNFTRVIVFLPYK